MHAEVSVDSRAEPPAAAGGAPGVQPGSAPSLAVDWEGIARPVAADLPAGPSLRYEGTYDAIEAARAADDPSLPQGIWQVELRRADWGRVAELCHEALVGRSKDLQLGVWLLEALIHKRGFAGAATGLVVLAALVERFWDDLHPLPDDDGLESRMAPLAWANAKLSDALRRVPLTEPTPVDPHRYAMADWLEASFAANRQRREPRGKTGEGSGRPSQDAIRQALAMLDGRALEAHRTALGEASAALEALDARLDALAGAEAPSLGRLRDEIAAILRLLDEVRPMPEPTPAAPHPPAEPSAEPSPEGQGEPAASSPAVPPGVPSVLEGFGPIESREQAYAVLDAVADHLLRIEPHSPAPYLVKRAVGWSRLSLAELLAEFMHQDGNLERLLYLLGIERPHLHREERR
jgi:type VI secretion system protein ImpA